LGQTKGTVSQSLKVLENRGLIHKEADSNDRRMVHLKLTDAGRRILTRVVPARFLATAWTALPTDVQDRLSDDLRELLRTAQQANKGRSFAACKTCRFNERDDGGWRCGLTGESLSEFEVDQLCREHEYAD
jgi:DNA-binding MarR family transcriptional regulator